MLYAKKIEHLFKILFNSAYRFESLAWRGHYNYLSDEEYIKRMFKAKMGYLPDLEDPRTFNEKLQWLKLHDRNSEYTTMVDKYAAKKWVADRIGEQYIIPTLGVWEHFDDIDFDGLPDQFVLKCTHDSGGLVIVKDKSKLDKAAAKRKIERCLKRNYYWLGREWPYKDVSPRIIAEQYMSNNESIPDNIKIEICEERNLQEYYDKLLMECAQRPDRCNSSELTDYKFMCFDGRVKCIFTVTERFSKDGPKVTFFDTYWTPLPFERHYPKSTKPIPRPYNLEKMIELAEKLSKDIPFVRVDFYESGRQIYFGEMTFYPGSGYEEFTPEEWDKKLGDWMEIPISAGGGYTVIEGIIVLINYAYVPTETDLRDYKFYCFNGKPEYCQVISDRSTYETIDFFDMDWNHQEFTGLALPHKPYSECEIPEPVTFEQMKAAAAVLSADVPFLRVDFYEINGRMYFGELTFYPASGFGIFEPDQWNTRFGNMIKLPG